MSLKVFTDAYCACILYAETGCPPGACRTSCESGGCLPLDRNFDVSDFSPEALERVRVDCEKFYRGASALTLPAGASFREDDAGAGMDFWLTRNGHGAGFWDGDWPEKQGEALTELAEEFGELNVYVGDDGKLYFA
jgi:hypothetical protein